MNNSDLSKMYDDFFGDSLVKNTSFEEYLDTHKESEEQEEVVEIDIDSLLLDNDSKELLKKIINYTKDYESGNVTNYINFNILFSSNNKETLENVLKALKGVSTKYIDNFKVKELSMYDYSKTKDFKNLFDNGIVVIKDLKAFDMCDEQDKTQFMFNFKKNLSDKRIVILFDESHSIDNFLTYDRELKSKYFNFKLNGIDPDIQDVYNQVLAKVNLDEEKKITLLDYITGTYLKNDEDFLTYRDKLINYISFNNDVPPLKKTKTNEEIFKELEELVGLSDVKKALKDLVNLIGLKAKTENDLKIKDINLHMLFLGNPGTGKTTVARLLSGILYNLGYIKEDKLIEVSSKDLVAEFVGQTAPKTNAVVERARGGILFIDEAYALASDGQNSYNDEAIATLIKDMEDYRDDLVVIFAGYTKEMQAFLNSNSGIVSRIGYTMNFQDYTVDELLSIFKQMISKVGFKITDGALNKAKAIIEENIGTKNFGNARFVRNMYEKTVVRHATNTKDKKQKEKLITITEEDINVENLINEK